MAVLAGPLLGERLGPGHWLAIGLGFTGALVIVRPTGASASCRFPGAARGGPGRWALLGALGLLGGTGHYLVARAFASGPASLISPFHYVQLLWAAAVGYLLFGDVPGALVWLGAALIIASGLYIAWRQAR